MTSSNFIHTTFILEIVRVPRKKIVWAQLSLPLNWQEAKINIDIGELILEMALFWEELINISQDLMHYYKSIFLRPNIDTLSIRELKLEIATVFFVPVCH